MSARSFPNAPALYKRGGVFVRPFVCDPSVFALFGPVFVRLVQGLLGPTLQVSAHWTFAAFCGFNN